MRGNIREFAAASDFVQAIRQTPLLANVDFVKAVIGALE